MIVINASLHKVRNICYYCLLPKVRLNHYSLDGESKKQIEHLSYHNHNPLQMFIDGAFKSKHLSHLSFKVNINNMPKGRVKHTSYVVFNWNKVGRALPQLRQRLAEIDENSSLWEIIIVMNVYQSEN